MPRFKTTAKKKLNKALKRVQRVVIQEIRNDIENQRKWTARVKTMKSQAQS